MEIPPQSLIPPPSRRRSLVTDLCAGISQAMGFWGCDARHPRGNQLVAAGFQRLEKDPALTEGSSRYRKPWQGGTIELHSFCAGWYSPSGEGVVFIRHRQRLFSCAPGEPIEPGRHTHRLEGKSNDLLLDLSRPFLAWMLDHERWILHHHGPAYRAACWHHVATLPGFRPWLEPAAATRWIEHLLADPDTTPAPANAKPHRHRTNLPRLRLPRIPPPALPPTRVPGLLRNLRPPPRHLPPQAPHRHPAMKPVWSTIKKHPTADLVLF